MNWICFEEKEKAFYDISMLPPFSYILFTLVSEKFTLSCTVDHKQTNKEEANTQRVYTGEEREKKREINKNKDI